MSAEISPRRDASAFMPADQGGDDAPRRPAPLADASAPVPEDPAEQAFSLLLSGELKFRQRNLLEAESYLRRAVDLHGRLPDVDPAERLRALDALGAVHVARGDLARAEPVLRDALLTADALLGPDHDDLGPYLNSLAHVLFKRRRYADAEPVLARLVALKRRLGDEHPEVAAVVANLALVHEALQRYESAETLWRCALAIRERSLPDDSPAVSMAREHLADMCAANGRPEEAIPLRERALAVRSRTLAPDNPQLAAAKAKLTALRVEGVRARIPVVVPQARTPERQGAPHAAQPVPRPPVRAARPTASTPALPRDVLDEIVRATTETPTQGVMAGMRGRARELLGSPLLRLITPRANPVPDDMARPDDEPDEDEAPARSPSPARPAAAARPLPPVVMPKAPVAKRLADVAPVAWDDDEESAADLELPDDGDEDAPRRFDLFGDSMWPKTRLVLTVVGLTLILAVAAAGVARMAGGSPQEPAASPAAAAAPVGASAEVSPETRRAMDAGLRALERSTGGNQRSAPSP